MQDSCTPIAMISCWLALSPSISMRALAERPAHCARRIEDANKEIRLKESSFTLKKP